MELVKDGKTKLWKETYPINFVEDVRLQDNAAHNTGSRGSLHDHLSRSKEEVEVGIDGGSIALLVDGELGSVGASVDGSSSGLESVQIVKIRAERRGRQALVSRASLWTGC